MIKQTNGIVGLDNVTDYYAISYQSLYSQLMLLLFFLSLRADEKEPPRLVRHHKQ